MDMTDRPDGLLPYRGKMTREEINALPLGGYEGPIRLIADRDAAAAAAVALGAEPILGFDTETRPAFRKGESYPPALLQLATADTVYIFRLGNGALDPSIITLLASPRHVKAGVAVADDVAELRKLAPFVSGGFVDLGDASRRAGLSTHGLRNLAANFLGFRISKKAQRSNWARDDLSETQIRYAATDAWVSREIYLAFRRLGIVADQP